MNSTGALALRSLVSLLILAAGGAGFWWLGTPTVPTRIPEKAPPPVVKMTSAMAHTSGIDFDVDGLVVPFREVQLAAQVGGQIVFKSDACRSGQAVRQGEVLLRIDPQDYELELRRLREQLSSADAMIAELEAEVQTTENQIELTRQQLEIDQRQLKRNEGLERRSAASANEVDTARRAELTTRNAMQSQMDQKNLLVQRRQRMRADKALVQADLDKAQLALSRTEIRAPFNGVVVSENVEKDGYVQPGTTMIVLQDSARLDVSCKLHMRQMHWLWRGQEEAAHEFSSGYDFPDTPATVLYELDGNRFAWQGVVDRYEGIGIDAQTRMVPCRVHVDDPTSVAMLRDDASSQATEQLVAARQIDDVEADVEPGDPSTGELLAPSMANDRQGLAGNLNPPTLMSGMFVKVRIHADPPIPLVKLPQSAIQPGNKVWVVRDGHLERKDVLIASSTRGHVVAYQRTGGLQAGDLVVTSPMATPVEGMKVMSEEEAAKMPKPKKKPGGRWGR
ncbi:MAG: HlyD family efflux transporter periplasmic adaptor subunit [Planctomycetota bacterium]